MKRILVPTDFSQAAEDALKLACTIAGTSGAEIYLVNFLPHPFEESFSSFGDVNTKYDDEETLFTIQLIRKSKAQLERLAGEYTDRAVINFEIFAKELIDGIEDYIRKEAIDFIVMGTSGEETAREFFTGNHTEQVIDRVNCPVLSLRAGQHETSFDTVVVGVDYRNDDKANYRAATNYLLDFAESMGSKLHLVHVSKPNADTSEVEGELADFAEKFHINNYTKGVQISKDIEAGLLRSVTATGAGIVCVLTHHEGGFFKIFSHSVSEDLSKESDVPVLSINLHRV